MEKTVLVTGGAGFIGSSLVRHITRDTDYRVINLDKLTYAGHRASVEGLEEEANYRFVKGDINDQQLVNQVLERESPAGIIHLAAESHVDRSIEGPMAFVETNVVGTANLLRCALEYWTDLKNSEQQQFRFLQVSTDEVYGELGEDGYFDENTAFDPSSPYAASKASGDMFVNSWYRTYGLPVLLTNCGNNYGPRQYPEKLIPVVILNALRGDKIPVYGDGQNVRDWIYVEDHSRALWEVFRSGRVGETYSIGARNERTNLEIVRSICRILDKLIAEPEIDDHSSLIEFVEDRPGHDFRYAIDASKIEEELDWAPQESFESGLRKTVQWYLENLEWCNRVMGGAYDLERLGRGLSH
jgi:dTDP-glucose 4,6-dehydratase